MSVSCLSLSSCVDCLFCILTVDTDCYDAEQQNDTKNPQTTNHQLIVAMFVGGFLICQQSWENKQENKQEIQIISFIVQIYYILVYNREWWGSCREATKVWAQISHNGPFCRFYAHTVQIDWWWFTENDKQVCTKYCADSLSRCWDISLDKLKKWPAGGARGNQLH